MSSFQIEFKFYQDLSEDDLNRTYEAMLRRISTGKLRVRTSEGLKDIAFETDIARWNGDPV